VLQAEQFELVQQKLIEHQQAQLEELFVAQRREQMNLQKEIEVGTYTGQIPYGPNSWWCTELLCFSTNVTIYSNKISTL